MNRNGRPRLCACGKCRNCKKCHERAYLRFSRAMQYHRWSLRFDEAKADIERLIYHAPAKYPIPFAD